jgi:four helix bundle protein
MMQMHFTKLLVWQKSVLLTKEAYYLAQKLPSSERFELASQIKRAAVSVSANIAEGSQRSTEKDFAHFLLMSKGSLSELLSHILIAIELNFLQHKDTLSIRRLIDETDKMLHAFHAKLVS